jgi:hypothetical protein
MERRPLLALDVAPQYCGQTLQLGDVLIGLCQCQELVVRAHEYADLVDDDARVWLAREVQNLTRLPQRRHLHAT